MNDKLADASSKQEKRDRSSHGVWVSRDSEYDVEISKEAREFLRAMEKSKESNRVIVGWRPD